jgi:hypothetical protein
VIERYLLLLSVAASTWLIAGSPALAGQEGEAPTTSPSCVHETVYEPFAGLILVQVTIGDSPPLDFVLDSGATQSSLTDPFLAMALDVKAREVGLARGVGSGAAPVLVSEDTCVRVDGVEALCTSLVVHDIGGQLAAVAGREIDGFLGADLFERYVVEIEPVTQRLLLHDPETFAYRGDGFELPLEVVDRRPIVHGTVVIEGDGKEVPVRLVVDTGSGRYLSLITKSRRRLVPPNTQKRGVSIGVVGGAMVVLASTRRLNLGSVLAENVETAWMDSFRVPAVRNIEDLNGILGNLLLSRFRAFFDYRGGRLILEPRREKGQ